MAAIITYHTVIGQNSQGFHVTLYRDDRKRSIAHTGGIVSFNAAKRWSEFTIALYEGRPFDFETGDPLLPADRHYNEPEMCSVAHFCSYVGSDPFIKAVLSNNWIASV